MGMYYVEKRLEISAAHKLELPYESKCQNLHGHNYLVNISCRCQEGQLTEYGMVIDFTFIKKAIQDKMDHQYLNDVMEGLNPTAENMAWWICNEINKIMEHGECYKVSVQESEGNIATYER